MVRVRVSCDLYSLAVFGDNAQNLSIGSCSEKGVGHNMLLFRTDYTESVF